PSFGSDAGRPSRLFSPPQNCAQTCRYGPVGGSGVILVQIAVENAAHFVLRICPCVSSNSRCLLFWRLSILDRHRSMFHHQRRLISQCIVQYCLVPARILWSIGSTRRI